MHILTSNIQTVLWKSIITISFISLLAACEQTQEDQKQIDFLEQIYKGHELQCQRRVLSMKKNMVDMGNKPTDLKAYENAQQLYDTVTSLIQKGNYQQAQNFLVKFKNLHQYHNYQHKVSYEHIDSLYHKKRNKINEVTLKLYLIKGLEYVLDQETQKLVYLNCGLGFKLRMTYEKKTYANGDTLLLCLLPGVPNDNYDIFIEKAHLALKTNNDQIEESFNIQKSGYVVLVKHKVGKRKDLHLKGFVNYKLRDEGMIGVFSVDEYIDL